MPPILSVIIPTYNRYETLRRTLDSLSCQELPPDRFEVILVDNGSADGTPRLAQETFPFLFTYLDFPRQTGLNLRAPTQARNLGARFSHSETLVFLDDDICIRPPGLQALNESCRKAEKTIFLGSLVLPDEILSRSSFGRAFAEPLPEQDFEIHYSFCKTGLLALHKDNFDILGGFQDPTGGWPNWDDVDFGYRAHCLGYRFIQCAGVIGEHWDYASLSLKAASQRLWQASKSAVRLLQVYPELRSELPMFYDALLGLTKLPLASLRSQKRGRQVIRNFARRVNASQAVLWSLENLAKGLEKIKPTSQMKLPVLRLLYNWILGGHIFRGFREGLREYGPLIS